MSSNGTTHADELRQHIGVLESVIENENWAEGEIKEINERLTYIENKIPELITATNKLVDAYERVAASFNALAARLSPSPVAVVRTVQPDQKPKATKRQRSHPPKH